MSKKHPRWRLAKKILTWLFFIAVAVLLKAKSVLSFPYRKNL
jgi:hypothetical protein